MAVREARFGRCAVIGAAFLALPSVAATSAVSPAAMPDTLPTIVVEVDTRDTVHKLISVRETIAVVPGALTLRYPRWIPGTHAPSGVVAAISGLAVYAGTRRLTWTRDPVDPFDFHVTVPDGVSKLTLTFDRLGALKREDGETFSSPRMVRVGWHQLLLYPAGRPIDTITAAATIVTPPGWSIATALAPIEARDGVTRYTPVPLSELIDSPGYAARFLGRHAVTASPRKPIVIDVAAEDDASAHIPAPQIAAFGRAFDQAIRLFGAEPYRHYDFLTTLSSRLTGVGLEHRESTEASLPPTYFSDPEGSYTLRHLLVHEYIHVWNGKLHRPAGLATPDYAVPMRDDLLWVYEGLTTYLDKILPVRGGLWTPQDGRDIFADALAGEAFQTGRRWRSLQDTTVWPIIGSAPAWQDVARSGDYYNDGALLWLDVDLRLRHLTGGRRSLDDFVRAFLAGSADPVVRTYDFGDVVAALGAVAPADWTTILRRRLDAAGTDTPPDALANSGYRLVYDERPSAWQQRRDRRTKAIGLDFSIGARIGIDGLAQSVSWGGAAFLAGLLPGDAIRQIDGQAFTPGLLRAAVAATLGAERAIRLTVDGADGPRALVMRYEGGLRFPHLERTSTASDRLDAIFAPL